MTRRATVSVALPCFNAQSFLPAALDSLLCQTFSDFEILALDDGSRDATPQILEAYAARDDRIRILRSEANLGLIETLNRAVGEAGGEFIARMDADDMAAPQRIERQLDALTRRPEVAVVGSAARFVSEDGGRLRPRPVRCLEPGGARFTALLATPLVHSTLMARAAVMRAHRYGASADSLHTEDYEMFARMLEAGVAFMNLDTPLQTQRVSRHGVSVSHEEIQIINFIACARRHLERTLGFLPDPGAHRVLVNRMDATTSARDLVEGLRWLERVEQSFLAGEPAAAEEVGRAAGMQLVDILLQAGLKGSPPVRLTAARLAVRYARRLRSSTARRYLATKLWPRAVPDSALALVRQRSFVSRQHDV